MVQQHPSSFHPDLTEDRLRIIAQKLLDIRHDTLQQMTNAYDDNYTRECAAFGRQRNMLVDFCKTSGYPWLELTNPNMDITFNIGEVPCRFFRDDPNSPSKPGFFKRNAVDNLFPVDDKSPVQFRFIVEKALGEEDEDQVYFVGYNELHEQVFQWKYRKPTSILHELNGTVPEAVQIPEPEVNPLDDEETITHNNIDASQQ